MTEGTTYPPPPNDPPPPGEEYNPEALEDVEPGTFRNVDLDNQQASRRNNPQGSNLQAVPVTSEANTTTANSETTAANQTLLLGALVSPFGRMNFKDQVALLGVFSLVVLIQSSVNCANSSPGAPYPCTEINGFAVAAGTLSLAACMAFFFFDAREPTDDKARLGFSLFSFLWWTSAMITLTFFGPFKTVLYANGFFGTWGAFFTAAMMLAHTSEIFRKSIHKLTKVGSHRPVMYLFIASVVEVGAAIDTCIPQSQCFNLNAFAIALGTISGILCLVLIPLMSRIGDRAIRNVAVFFCMWWVVGGMIVTFEAPFQTLGNGYFSVFAAIVSSFYLLQAVELD